MNTHISIHSRIFAAVIIINILGLHFAFAQDAHFSQFYASPLTLNPALSGTSGSTYRVAVNYRDQWRGALDNPLKTFSANGDLRYHIGQEKTYRDIASVGFLFYADQVSDFDLNTNQIGIVGSYHKSLSRDIPQYLGVGAQFGLLQKSINYEDLYFQDQFNAIDGFDLPSGELLPANNFAFLDFTIGLNYAIQPSKSTKYLIGASYAHFTQPNASFYRIDPSPNPSLVKVNALYSKISAYISTSFQTGLKTDIQPRILFLNQGPHTEINLGTNIRYNLAYKGNTKLHFGPWLRMVGGEAGFGVESVVLSTGIELGKFVIGLSYDHNLSDLIRDRSGLNALEISITFLGEPDDDGDGWCPKF